jgi:hypothetical protein
MVRARRSLLWLVMVALVTAQAIGLMHRTLHLPHGQQLAHAHAHSHDHDHDAHGFVAALFDSHESDADCRLFDPLSHDGLPGLPVLALPAVAAFFFLDAFQGEFLVRWAALFDARGPPSPR